MAASGAQCPEIKAIIRGGMCISAVGVRVGMCGRYVYVCLGV